jgi:hypothetical protein
MTGADHQHSAAVDEAARWLADQHQPPKPIVPALRQRFGLSSLQATEACAMAQRFRMLRGAMA